ncbi:MAG: T9SS type A sorting domain-containing protein [Calditrichaceae bacterium]|nr:T9SS type A sorting domain-containing protein [Calditrichaceae bacterium]
MRNMFRVLLILMAVMTLSFNCFAGETTVTDDILMIPYTFDAPTIDGDLDDIWKNVTAERMLIFEAGAPDPDPLFADHWSIYRVMYDSDNFYLFLEVQDDSTEGHISGAAPWEMDNMELFIDGGNERAAAYDGNDVQWRWVYDAIDSNLVSASQGPGEFSFKDTDHGYNLEMAIPYDSLTFSLDPGTDIGFEISCKDVDSEIYHVNRRWWTDDGNAWNNPQVFGTASLDYREISSGVLDIRENLSDIEVDGAMNDDEGWYGLPEFPMEVYENGDLPAEKLSTWDDFQASFWVSWDADNLYVFVKVIDDSLEGHIAGAAPWEMDNIELFIDGGYERAAAYDDNDVQWRWVYDAIDSNVVSASQGPGVFAFLDTDEGYNFELSIPADSLTFDLEEGEQIGFEISCKDVDSEKLNINRRWWTEDGNAWNNPQVFGAAELMAPVEVAIKDPDLGNELKKFALNTNYPNPFNPSTTIPFTLDAREQVTVTVHNVLGQKVATLVDGIMSAGSHKVSFNGASLPSGIYFYRLQTQSKLATGKMMLLK